MAGRVDGEQEDLTCVREMLPVQFFLQPSLVQSALLEITAHQSAVVDEDGGQEYVILYLFPHLSCREGLTVRAQENG